MPEYETITNLKKVFLMEDCEDVTLSILRNMANEQALREIYLISYLIDMLLKEVKNFEEQKIIYNKIYDNLILGESYNYRICNMIIYSLCNDILNDSLYLSDDIYINFGILQKWLRMQKTVEFEALSSTDKGLVLFMSNGFAPSDIIGNDMLNLKSSREYISNYIFNDFPQHCGAKSLIQAIGIVYLSNSYLRDTNKSFELYSQYVN